MISLGSRAVQVQTPGIRYILDFENGMPIIVTQTGSKHRILLVNFYMNLRNNTVVWRKAGILNEVGVCIRDEVPDKATEVYLTNRDIIVFSIEPSFEGMEKILLTVDDQVKTFLSELHQNRAG